MAAFYCKSFKEFLLDNTDSIVGALTRGASDAGFYQQLHSQTDSWNSFINLLKENLPLLESQGIDFNKSGVLLEYPIPRREKRIDCVLIVNDLIIVVEFKEGEDSHKQNDIVQVEDYCLDLRDFHAESKDRIIIPVLLATQARNIINSKVDTTDGVKRVYLTNESSVVDTLIDVNRTYSSSTSGISFQQWDSSSYAPTPTIIEAAQSLYAGKSVREISRSHAGAENLTRTTDAIIDAIKEARTSNSKIICFITGVPGAGKTLAGLNIVHNKEFSDTGEELGVFLSGNSPLIKVLTEALARDFSNREKGSRGEARRKVKTFIQNVHRFIDEYYTDKSKSPIDKVVIFDEAQRAWDAAQSKRKFNRDFSEAEMMLDVMDRHSGWAVIVALVGGGQEINNGEAGLPEWGKTITEKFSHWKIAISNELLEGDHSTGNMTLFDVVPDNVDIKRIEALHLRVSIRAFRAQELSRFVSLVLENNPSEARALLNTSLREYPLFITRSLQAAKQWLQLQQRGSRRIGLVATSGARRLRPYGLDVKGDLEVEEWFLNNDEDVRSSFALETPATEFAIQGLELDWTALCWDADLRRNNNQWDYKAFKGTKWMNVNQSEKQKFILNKYRVLMTRAREGMIIWVPEGEVEDDTRNPKYYNDIYEYLKSCGIPEVK